MPRAKDRPVTMDGMRHAMSKGVVEVWACNDPDRPGPQVKNLNKEDAITVSMHFCTAFLSRAEVADLMLALENAACKQWGEYWMTGLD